MCNLESQFSVPCIENEFKNSNYKPTITNNSANQGPGFELTIDVDINLRIQDNQFPIRV